MLDLVDLGPPGLIAALYTRDLRRAFRAVEGLRAGRVHVNVPSGGKGAGVPFAGFSFGRTRREAVLQQLDACAVWKVTTFGALSDRPPSRTDGG
jgi:acyl-CoA reductase-like NAD-dependent aldehyde dehydrogenase